MAVRAGQRSPARPPTPKRVKPRNSQGHEQGRGAAKKRPDSSRPFSSLPRSQLFPSTSLRS
uniref:Uncharacterized protein n=1 Tax=Arundo donax TaxID=35708 RepID=A0A0A9G5Z3_ARUDO